MRHAEFFNYTNKILFGTKIGNVNAAYKIVAKSLPSNNTNFGAGIKYTNIKVNALEFCIIIVHNPFENESKLHAT